MQQQAYSYKIDKAKSSISASLIDIDDNLYIVDKKDNLVRYIPNAFQRDLDSKLTGRDLVLKYRQGGASTFFIAKKQKEAWLNRSRIGIMAHDAPTTQKLRRMAQTFWEYLPDDVRPIKKLDNASTTSYAHNGSEITIATAGSKDVGIGGTYPGGFLGDEVAMWKDAQNTMVKIIQGVPLHAPIALISTPNGASGWFYDRCMEARDDPDSIWTLHFYAWWWDEGYKIELLPDEILEYTDEESALATKHNLSPEQIKYRRYKQKELLEDFQEAYPEDPVSCFLTTGNSVYTITQDMLYTPEETGPIDGHVYAMGVDWGQDEDSTSVSIIDATDYREVFVWYTRRRDDDAIISDIADLAIKWNVILCRPEYNGMGAQYVRRLQVMLSERQAGASHYTIVDKFIMSLRSKDKLVKMLKFGLGEGLKLVDDEYANAEIRIFQTTKQTSSGIYSYGHPSGKHDDTVIARLLAHEAAQRLA